MRYIVYGAGGIGSAVGGRLFATGHDTVLVTRGAHHDALVRDGLRLASPEGRDTLPVPTVATVDDARPGDGDVVLLAMKSQDTEAALEALAGQAATDLPVLCLQNGVENERRALRRFEQVYGVCVVLPATYLEPGCVDVHAAPVWGILDLGRYPAGVDGRCDEIARDLVAAGFSSNPTADVMRWKYGKLLINLGNALEAACGREALESELGRRIRAEGRACLDWAGIEVVSDDEDRARRQVLTRGTVDGRARQGSSSWQSLVRGTGTAEADYLNGEVAMLGRTLGVPTPANIIIQGVAHRMARERMSPGSFPLATLLAALASADAASAGVGSGIAAG
ncbi:MAG: ketopantoate reductase family protein [Acidimicrobiales bacterium]